MDGERLNEVGDDWRKAPVTAGSNAQRPAQMGTDGESPPSELEIDGDMLAETGSMLPPLEI